MQLTPVVAIHLTAAASALVIGPFALWTRLGMRQRPKLHRALGYAWVSMMILAAASSLFLRDFNLPNIAGYTPIHLLVPAMAIGLFLAFRHLARGNISGHRAAMQYTYIAGGVVAGAFTLLPGRLLGRMLWSNLLGLV